MGLGGEPRKDDVDDGRAGDDFLTRAGLRQLLADAQRGDVIVCRDQSSPRPRRDRGDARRARPRARPRLPALRLRDRPRGAVRERPRSGDDADPGHRPPDGARGDPLTHARGTAVATTLPHRDYVTADELLAKPARAIR